MSFFSCLRTAARAAALLLALTVGGCHGAGAGDRPAADGPDLALLKAVMKEVESAYVNKVTESELVADALKGMLSRLDPHSSYLDERQYEEMMSVTRGRFGGIGVELNLEAGVPQVISAIDGTPAAAAGIEPGDLIVRIEDQPTSGMNADQIVKRLRGAVGTKVTLTIERKRKAPFNIALTRALIQVVSVKSALEPDRIGYARLTTFVENTPSELAAAIKELKRHAGGRLGGFILDLRNNPGGLLDSAVGVAGDFLDGGTVVTTRGRNEDDDRAYAAPPSGDMLQGVPVVVLINSASASASEIVAGALQDHGRATVMGTRSFGKGSVQSIIPLDGEGALRLTTALYYTPSGRSIQDRGIEPNIVVALPKDEQVPNAIISHERDLYGALKNTGPLAGSRGEARGPRPESGEPDQHPIKPTLIGTKSDSQLEAAIDFLETKEGRGRPAQRTEGPARAAING
jgi:carboxyl-terminal processing protease